MFNRITPDDLFKSNSSTIDDKVFTQDNFEAYLQAVNSLRAFEDNLKKSGQGNNNPQEMDSDVYAQWKQLQNAVLNNPFAKNRDKYVEFLQNQNKQNPNLQTGQGEGQGYSGTMASQALRNNNEPEFSDKALEDELRRQLYTR